MTTEDWQNPAHIKHSIWHFVTEKMHVTFAFKWHVCFAIKTLFCISKVLMIYMSFLLNLYQNAKVMIKKFVIFFLFDEKGLYHISSHNHETFFFIYLQNCFWYLLKKISIYHIMQLSRYILWWNVCFYLKYCFIIIIITLLYFIFK